VRVPAAALAIAATALLAAGCGTGGIAKGGDASKGKQLFQAKCGGCHTMADAGTHGQQGPDLDDAFGPDRKQGFKQETIEQVVRDQIELAIPPMPQNLVTGEDADAVAAYVAQAAGTGATAAKNSTNGKDIFTANCGSCHTLADAGTSGTVGPNLDQLKPSFEIAQHQVINGGGAMPAFKGTLTPAQITAVAKYVSSVAGKS
jgi:cbb3-type cytochrome c oxidase subunit III